MRLVDVHARLLQMKTPVFRTSDAAACLSIGNAHASKLAERLAAAGHMTRLGRGLWGFKNLVEPLTLPEYLTYPYPSYVSLQTAMYYHGLISQIPAVIYAVSISRTKRYETPLGSVSVHHIHPSFFFGFESTGKGPLKMATMEKALIDVLYLSPARSQLFRAFPEVEFPKGFKVHAARKIIGQIRSLRRRSLVSRLFEGMMET
jgi:predicted transcriptional regulator of viral defense system